MKIAPVTDGFRSNCLRYGSRVAQLNPMKLRQVAVDRASRIVLQSAMKTQMLPDFSVGRSPWIKMIRSSINPIMTMLLSIKITYPKWGGSRRSGRLPKAEMSLKPRKAEDIRPTQRALLRRSGPRSILIRSKFPKAPDFYWSRFH